MPGWDEAFLTALGYFKSLPVFVHQNCRKLNRRTWHAVNENLNSTCASTAISVWSLNEHTAVTV